MRHLTPEQIDALLPQTQCGLCGYGGCMPYAEALVYEQAPINLRPPGGVKTLRALGVLLQQNSAPFEADMEKAAKPKMRAVIREAECIGCTKCIQACPVDSILGAGKLMHTVITSECTGCELCVAPCPVDCIDMVTLENAECNEVIDHEMINANNARKRYQARQLRLIHEKSANKMPSHDSSKIKRKSYIEDAIARVKAKKSLL